MYEILIGKQAKTKRESDIFFLFQLPEVTYEYIRSAPYKFNFIKKGGGQPRRPHSLSTEANVHRDKV